MSQSGWRRFWIGGAGALLPLLVTLYALDLASLIDNYEEITPGVYAGTSIRYFILFLLGGIVAALHSDEDEPIKLVQIGIAAPALISSFINASAAGDLPEAAPPTPVLFSQLLEPPSGLGFVGVAKAAERDRAAGPNPREITLAGDFLKDFIKGATRPVSKAIKKPGTSTICAFNHGPRAGTRIDYAPRPAIPIGSPCHDGAGSTGVVVTAGDHAEGGTFGAEMSTICEFNNGPKAGTRFDYAPRPPVAVGTPCYDGAGSTGVVVSASGQAVGGEFGGAVSTICHFTSGPRAGTRLDYAPRPPVPVGSACHDGAGSAGSVVSAGD